MPKVPAAVAHAGPMVDLRISGTFNVASWNLNTIHNLHAVAAAPDVHVWALQETRRADAVSRRMASCPQGRLVLGHSRPIYRQPGQKKENENTGMYGGVGILLTPGYRGGSLSQECSSPVLQAAYRDGRWQKAWVATGTPKRGFHPLQYLWSGRK